MLELPPKLAADMLYNDLEPESSKHWTSLLKPQSVGYVCFRCLLIIEDSGF